MQNAQVHVKNFDANKQKVPEKIHAESVVGSGVVRFATTLYPGPGSPLSGERKLPEVWVTATGFTPAILDLGFE